jgi:hypothetical protein
MEKTTSVSTSIVQAMAAFCHPQLINQILYVLAHSSHSEAGGAVTTVGGMHGRSGGVAAAGGYTSRVVTSLQAGLSFSVGHF